MFRATSHPAAPEAPVVLVADEVGFGVVPDNPMARAFRDHAGRLNQALAGRMDRVMLVGGRTAEPPVETGASIALP